MSETLTPRTQRKKAREQEKIRARRDQRATYDLPIGLRERMRALAEEQCLPASQLVTLALLRFLKEFEQGEIPLSGLKQPSRSPRYDWNLQFPAELEALIQRKR